MSSKTAPDAAWSLAARLTVWYAASFFVLSAAVAGFVYVTLVGRLEEEDDHFMAEKAELAVALLSGRDGPTGLAAPPTIHMRILTGTGATRLVTDGMDGLLPADRFPPSQPPGRVRGRERWLDDGRCFRVASVRIGEHVVQLGMDRTTEEEQIYGYRRTLAFVLLAALAASTGLGYMIARRGIRPVEQIADAARRVGGGTLDARIPTAHLPAELASLAGSFNAMLDRLEQAFDRLRRFSSDLAHELRTPVNNLRGELEVALGKPRPADEYRDALASALEECGRLTATVDGLLLLARAEGPRGANVTQPLDVVAELHTVSEFYEASAAEAGVRLRVEAVGRPIVPLNRALFQRAVANLVANAIAHTPSGGDVVLRAEEGGIVTVRDTGRGIAAEHLPRIFERFYRVDGRPGGLGLGLAIVRGVAELHGGRVEMTSEPGRGTTVTMVFPS